MTRTIFGALAIMLMMATQATRAAEETDKQPLQGTWVVVSCEKDGKSDDDVVDDKFTFEADKVTVQRNSSGKKNQAVFTINPQAAPAEIDVKLVNKEVVTVLGIYELNGDRLKICFRDGEGARPTEFAAKPNSHAKLLVLDRAKQDSK